MSTTSNGTNFLTDAQLQAEISRCEYCESKHCRTACPAHCSPADFIMAVKIGEKSDYKRAAAMIMGANPLGGVCGVVCPDTHCMKACSRSGLDRPVNIPAVQATIIERAKQLGVMPEFKSAEGQSQKAKIAVVGAGPAGLSAAATLAQKGHKVDVFESYTKAGGASTLIPDFRLNKKVLKSDLEFLLKLGSIRIKTNSLIKDPQVLKGQGYEVVLVSTGLTTPIKLGIKGEDAAITALNYLREPGKFKVKGKRVAIVGGGAVAADCAETACKNGATHVELITLEKLDEMPLTAKERSGLMEAGVHFMGRTKVSAIHAEGKKVRGLKTVAVALAPGKKFHPANVTITKGTEQNRKDIELVITAIGNRPSFKVESKQGIFYSGDMENGPTTVVEAVAAGKNAAQEIAAFLNKEKRPRFERKTKSEVQMAPKSALPVSLEADFFGRKIISPFILSAAPPSDGYEQMKKAYEAGWAGGVMKTAFDGIQIHIPGEYMFAFNEKTYGNCDNVSGHPLDRVCREIGLLVQEFPDRLTIGSTGGPVTGNDESDKRGWQSNTRKLEQAGAMGIEYSLSCPQGGDGTKGDIVSQDPELTAKIIDWVMQVSDPNVPKLFKLTGAVTAIYPIIVAIKEVFARYPGKKAGVTLANTFPTLAFRKGKKATWEEGVVVGMSGDGVAPISNLTLANVSNMGVVVSGNGGPMDYKSAAHFLALGAKTVQFCTIAMKHGYGIIDELHSGLSYLMEDRGISSVAELIGKALPNPVTGFMELTSEKKISAVTKELCLKCGNCTRCPYLAISIDKKRGPVTDPSRCVGCSICVQKCFAKALFMRDRTTQEKELLNEA